LASLHLLVIGDGELRRSLEQQAERLGLASRVHFAGARRDLGNVLAAIDVFVMPSLWEGLPLSLVLAMGAGLPVIASRVAGIPEVVHHEQSGVLVTPGDAGELSDALVRVITNAAFGASLGRAAKTFVVPRFGVDGYIASMTALYRRLLAGKQLA
jgi:glycosyltransferase involved in cell wall biosynthesis